MGTLKNSTFVSECVYAHNAMSKEINLELHLSGSKQGYLGDYRQSYLKLRNKKHQPPTPGEKKENIWTESNLYITSIINYTCKDYVNIDI